MFQIDLFGRETEEEDTTQQDGGVELKQAVEVWLNSERNFNLIPPCDAVKFKDETWAWCPEGTSPYRPLNDKYWEIVELTFAFPSDLLTEIAYGNHGKPDLTFEKTGWVNWAQAPKNNDERSQCYVCREPTRFAGGGLYRICQNKDCSWYDM